jgi:hypothetical protein
MLYPGMCHRVGIVRTDVSVECVTSIFMTERIREQETVLAVGSRNTFTAPHPSRRHYSLMLHICHALLHSTHINKAKSLLRSIVINFR